MGSNAPGAYYVTDQCVDCGSCHSNYPVIYRLEESLGSSIVHHQPTTPEEIAMAEEGLEGCPVEAIQRDGET